MAAWEKKDESRKRTMNSWGRGDVERGGREGESAEDERARKGHPEQEGERVDGESRTERGMKGVTTDQS